MKDPKVCLLKLRRLLRSRGRTIDDTEDLIQEAFLRLHVYSRRHVVAQEEAFLVRTVLNLSVNKARRDKRERLEHGILESLVVVDPRPTPDAVYGGQMRLQHWKRGLAALSPRRREVFLLNRVDGYSFPQIAERLGITLSMVEKHAARAALFLTDWMETGD